MTRVRLSIAALAAALVACAPPAPPSSPPPPSPPHAPSPPVDPGPAALAQHFADDTADYVFTDPDRRKKLASAFPALDALGEAAVGDHGLPGLSLGVVVDGELVYAKGFGFTDLQSKARPDADTQYRIGSITKSFTALAILALRDDGALALDDPLTRFLPEAAGLVYPTRDAPPITLRQILTHTSGLPRLGNFDYTRADAEPSEQDILGSLAAFPLLNTPGTVHVYSNLGYALLGLVVAHAAHVPLRAFMARRILAPLGMTSTAFDASALPAGKLATGYDRTGDGPVRPVAAWRLGASEGAGGIVSTVRDLARYVAFQLDAYPSRSAPEAGPVRRSSVREAHESALRSGRLWVGLRDDAAKGESMVEASAGRYGFAWSVRETCDTDFEVSHNGAVSGFTSQITFLPEAGVGVIALGNLSGDRFQVGTVAEDALKALRRTGGLSNRVRRAHLSPLYAKAMERFLGVYDAWDEAAYKAMLSPKRGHVLPEDEKRELAGYRGVNGACRGYDAVEVRAPRDARLAMRCERGSLDMDVTLDEDGLILGFAGTSRDVPAPPAFARAAARIAGLVGKWDEAVYRKVLGKRKQPTRAESLGFFEKARARHGACVPGAYTRTDAKQEMRLVCDRGGDLALSLALDPGDEEAVDHVSLVPASGGPCPVR